MIASEIARTYAKALYELSPEADQLEQRLKAFDLLNSILNQKDLMTFFISPQISLEQKEAILEKVLGSQIDHTFLSFLKFLLKKNFFIYFQEIFEQFREMVNERFGFLNAHLKTAFPLEESVLETLKLKLEKIYDKKIVLQTEVNQELLGGGILTIDHKILDFSLKDKLNVLKQTLLSSPISKRSSTRKADAIET